MSFTPISTLHTSKPTSSFTPIDSAPVAAPSQSSGSPGFFSNVLGGIKTIATDVIGAAKSAFTTAPKQDLFSNPSNAPTDTVRNLVTSLSDAGKQMISGASTLFDNHQTALSRGVGAAEAGLGVINAAFAPVNAVIDYAQHVPGLGTLATGLNALFGAIGAGGADTAEGAVQALPISQPAKDQILPVARQAAALAAQIIVGKVGGDAFTKLADHTSTILDHVTTELKVARTAIEAGPEQLPKGFTPISASVPESVPITRLEKTITPTNETPAEQPVPFQNRYTAPGDLPVIPAGPKPKEALPTIQAGAPPKVPTGYSYEPTKDSVPSPLQPSRPTQEPAPPHTAAPPAPAPARATQPAPVKPVATAELPSPLKTEPGVSKIGKSIEVKAVEANLTRGFDGTAGYDPITIKDQAERATKLVNESTTQARAIIRGEAPLPEGLKGTALITAMEQHLVEHPNADLAYDLANSPHVSGTSAAAQEMRLMAERVPDSITAKYKEIKAAREAALEKRGGAKKAVKQITDEIQREIKRNVSKRPSWEDFVKEVQCNY